MSLSLARPRAARRVSAPQRVYHLAALPPTLRLAIGGASRALRRQQAAEGGVLGLRVGLGLALALALTTYLWPLLGGWLFFDRLTLIAWAVLTVAGITLLGLLVGSWGRHSPMLAARALDDRLELRERIGTALELAGQQPGGPLDADQAGEAAVVLAGRDWRPAFRSRLGRRPLLTAAALAAGLALVLALPNPRQAALDERAATRRAVAAAAEQVAAARDTAATRRDLDAAHQAALTETLTALEQTLRQGTLDRRGALARIAAAETTLRQGADPTLDRRLAALDRLGQELLTSSDTTGAGRALRADDPAAAARELASLAHRLDRLDDGEQQALASKLERAAGQAGDNPALAGRLGEAATALQAGDTARASADLAAAAEALRDLAAARTAQAATEQALTDLATTRAELTAEPTTTGASRATPAGEARRTTSAGQAGSSARTAPGGAARGENQPGTSTNGRQPGAATSGQPGATSGQPGATSGQPGAAASPGSGSGQGSGAAGAGAGRVAGATAPRTDGGTAGAGQPILDRPGRTGVDEYASVYAPEFTGSSGQIEAIPGQDRGEGAADRQPIQAPAGGPVPLVPYERVYSRYRQQATDAIEGGRVPPPLRDYVRDYFTALDG